MLWVKLQLQTIAGKNSDNEILRALDELPKDLPETFERLLYKSVHDSATRRIFGWVAVAKRPLTLPELREAISIEPLQKLWNPMALVNDMRKVIAGCNHLIVVDEEAQTAHFTHGSAKRYILEHSIKQHGRSNPVGQALPLQPFINKSQAEQHAGAICITYMKLPDFEKRLVRTAAKSVGASAISATVIESLDPTSSTNRLALRLLKSVSDGHDMPLGELFNHTQTVIPPPPIEHHFLAYATRFWLWHTGQIGGSDAKGLRKLWRGLVSDIVEEQSEISNVPWTPDDLKYGSGTVTAWVIDQGHFELAKLLAETKRADNLFYHAMSRDKMTFFELCLTSGSMSLQVLSHGLILTSVLGRVDMARSLLQAGASPSVELEPDNWSRCPKSINPQITPDSVWIVSSNNGGWYELRKDSHARAERARLSRMRMNRNTRRAPPRLRGFPPLPVSDNYNNATALLIAAYYGHRDIVQLLLHRNDADVNYENAVGSSALSFATYQGHDLIVDDLVAAGASRLKTQLEGDPRSPNVNNIRGGMDKWGPYGPYGLGQEQYDDAIPEGPNA